MRPPFLFVISMTKCCKHTGKYVPVYLNGKHSIKYDSQFKKTATGITLMQVAAKLYRRTYFLECLLLPRYLHAGHSNP